MVEKIIEFLSAPEFYIALAVFLLGLYWSRRPRGSADALIRKVRDKNTEEREQSREEEEVNARAARRRVHDEVANLRKR